MGRKLITACLFFALFLVSSSAGSRAHAADSLPAVRNVVLIVLDDMGLQAGCYGDKIAKTPGIDRLAAEGIRFTRAYCTTASCSASRSVLLTGLYNHATGLYGLAHGYNHFSAFDRIRSLPVILAEAGYRTCSIGKVHVNPESVFRFETYANEGIQGARNSVRMAQNAREWIQADDDRPFFLYFCTTDPHRSGGGQNFANRNADGYPGVEPVSFEPETMIVPPWLPDIPEVRAELAGYYQSIHRADQGVDALIDVVQETGHWDDTLIILLSDNGPPFPGAKTTLYEPGVHLPLVVRHPGVSRKGGVCDARVTWADITPTILEACGIKPEAARVNAGPGGAPSDFQGRSILRALEEEHPAGFDEVFLSHTFHEITMYYPMRCIISGKYKYIVNFAHELPYPFASDLYRSSTWQAVLAQNRTQYGKRSIEATLHHPRFELYDLEADPDELHNLADDEAHRPERDCLEARLKEFQARTRDPWVLKWDRE